MVKYNTQSTVWKPCYAHFSIRRYSRNFLAGMTLFLLLITSSCTTSREGTPWYRNTPALWSAYKAAVADAAVDDMSKITRLLPAITAPGDHPDMQWITEDGKEMVLLGSMMDRKDAETWQTDTSFMYDGEILWATLPHDFLAHFAQRMHNQPCKDSLECRMRMLQMLGLPPDCTYDTFVFFYADKDSILRPSPDPEIDDTEAGLEFSPGATEAYRKWFEDNARFSYESATPFPWTRLGYTYDWHPGADKRGPGEFIIPSGTRVRTQRIEPAWLWYQQKFPGNASGKKP